MKETKAEKSYRILREGRLRIYSVTSTSILAECRGDTETYRLTYMGGHWTCDCPARVDCSHLSALWLVTVKQGAAT